MVFTSTGFAMFVASAFVLLALSLAKPIQICTCSRAAGLERTFRSADFDHPSLTILRLLVHAG